MSRAKQLVDRGRQKSDQQAERVYFVRLEKQNQLIRELSSTQLEDKEVAANEKVFLSVYLGLAANHGGGQRYVCHMCLQEINIYDCQEGKVLIELHSYRVYAMYFSKDCIACLF